MQLTYGILWPVLRVKVLPEDIVKYVLRGKKRLCEEVLESLHAQGVADY
jgi:hypothetical protein